jgi:glutamate--glyoxylate aminotransferase
MSLFVSLADFIVLLPLLMILQLAGISTVPGSGFGQAEGTFHLRTTILPREEKMAEFVELFRKFHEGFMKQYK